MSGGSSRVSTHPWLRRSTSDERNYSIQVCLPSNVNDRASIDFTSSSKKCRAPARNLRKAPGCCIHIRDWRALGHPPGPFKRAKNHFRAIVTARVLSDHRNPTLGDLGRHPEDVERYGNAWSCRRHALFRSGGRKWSQRPTRSRCCPLFIHGGQTSHRTLGVFVPRRRARFVWLITMDPNGKDDTYCRL